jgi:hypothetical protein
MILIEWCNYSSPFVLGLMATSRLESVQPYMDSSVDVRVRVSCHVHACTPKKRRRDIHKAGVYQQRADNRLREQITGLGLGLGLVLGLGLEYICTNNWRSPADKGDTELPVDVPSSPDIDVQIVIGLHVDMRFQWAITVTVLHHSLKFCPKTCFEPREYWPHLDTMQNTGLQQADLFCKSLGF